MSILNGLTMLGGLAFFLYGMNCMEDGLSKLSGGRLEQMLEHITASRLKAVALGIVVTALIQSSSATTVMVVGLVNSGLFKLSQAVGVIMGANVGTTITSWILSLSGIQSDNIFIKLLKPVYFSPVLAIIGVVYLMFSKKDRKKSLGIIFVGFAILMFGMDTMSKAVAPLADVPEFTRLLTMFSNPVLGLVAGAVLTAVIQSSSASVGILQTLCMTGSVTVGSAVPIIMGQNIGTCATALLSGIGANVNAKRAALVHLYFNTTGTVLFMSLFYAGDALFNFHFMEHTAGTVTIALLHSAFNITSTFILLPFSGLLEKMAVVTIKNENEETPKQTLPKEKFQILDGRFLEMPSFAMEQCRGAASRMADLAKKGVVHALHLMQDYTKEEADRVHEIEDLVDRYEDELGTYLVRLSKQQLSGKDSKELNTLLHCIGDFERISDHAMNIKEAAQEMYEKKLVFSEEAAAELGVYKRALENILELSMGIFYKEDAEGAKLVEPLEEVIDNLSIEMKSRHIKRLRAGVCTIELGFVLSDLIANFERIADHCSNIAVCLIQIKENGMEVHEYLEMVKHDEHNNFMKMVEENKKKYNLPDFPL